MSRMTMSVEGDVSRPSRRGFHDDVMDADVQVSLGFTSRMGTYLTGAPREVALRNAVDAAIQSNAGRPAMEAKVS